jgi:valyl-tRNA synthetase
LTKVYWAKNETFKASNTSDKTKNITFRYVPYPSELLHVGHPLGYIASDIYARWANVIKVLMLHPQGYDYSSACQSNMLFKQVISCSNDGSEYKKPTVVSALDQMDFL